MNSIIGKKLFQSQAFLADGTRVPVTVVNVDDNTVLGVKTDEKDGYKAVQLAYGRKKNSVKAILGQAKKAGLNLAPLKIREVKASEDEETLVAGAKIALENVLKPGDIVKVTGISKGKGFAGVVKRHHFRGGPRTHGQSDRERAPGSIGQTTTPGRVYRGKKMAGRMGHETVSILNLQVVGLQLADGSKKVVIKGLVPGAANSLVLIEKTGELPSKKFVPLNQTEEKKEAIDMKENTEGIVSSTTIEEPEAKAIQSTPAESREEAK